MAYATTSRSSELRDYQTQMSGLIHVAIRKYSELQESFVSFCEISRLGNAVYRVYVSCTGEVANSSHESL